MVRNVNKKLDVEKYKVERIVRTELHHTLEQATLQSYKDSDVEKYEFCTEAGACDICKSVEQFHFVKDAIEGENFPLMHPNCYCFTMPVLKTLDEMMEEAFPEDFEHYYSLFEKEEPKITNQLSQISRNNNVKMAGLEYKLKTKESLIRKIDKDVLENGKTKLETLSNINDILRYTVILDNNKFTNQFFDIKKDLENSKISFVKIKNTWYNENAYKGINCILKKGSTKFELQFHTEESFKLKNGVLHKLYEKQRDVKSEIEEKEKLIKEMIKLSNQIKNPKDIDKIK